MRAGSGPSGSTIGSVSSPRFGGYRVHLLRRPPSVARFGPVPRRQPLARELRARRIRFGCLPHLPVSAASASAARSDRPRRCSGRLGFRLRGCAASTWAASSAASRLPRRATASSGCGSAGWFGRDLGYASRARDSYVPQPGRRSLRGSGPPAHRRQSAIFRGPARVHGSAAGAARFGASATGAPSSSNPNSPARLS